MGTETPATLKWPADRSALEAAKVAIAKDISEIEPGKWYRDDNPELLVLTTGHLDLILRRHLLGEDV